MTNQNEYLKSTKLITAHYGEEYEHYYNAIVPRCPALAMTAQGSGRCLPNAGSLSLYDEGDTLYL